jgi:hypothetical protein
LIFEGMVGVQLPEELPADFLELRRRYTDRALPTMFLDRDPAPVRADLADAALTAAAETIEVVRGLPLPFLPRL